MKPLMHNILANNCYGESHEWSCVVRSDHEDWGEREGNPKYGWQPHENAGMRDKRYLKDTSYNMSAEVPRLATLYHKMSMPEDFKEELLGWWHENKHKVEESEKVPGNYLNDHDVVNHKLNLDDYPHMKTMIEERLKPFVEHWVPMSEMVPTSTYGVRQYRRGSFMLNHYDRHQTHHASFILNVEQEGCDEGWPLELHPPFGVRDVYMQPGEMILYEGAKIMHGRPMRSPCDSYANIFVHFTPKDYKERQRLYVHEQGFFTAREMHDSKEL